MTEPDGQGRVWSRELPRRCMSEPDRAGRERREASAVECGIAMTSPSLPGLLLGCLALAGAWQRTEESRAVPLAASDAVLGGHGPSRSIEIAIEADGTLDLWAESKALDPYLRVEDASGKRLAEDDDSARAKRPWIALEVAKGQKLVVRVASSNAGDLGEVELHIARWTEDEATRAARERSARELDEVKKLRDAKDLDAARAKAEAAIDELLALAPEKCGPALERILWSHIRLAAKLGCTKASIRALNRLIELLQVRYPADHPEIAQAWNELGIQHYGGGEFSEAVTAMEKVVAIRERSLDPDDLDLQRARGNLASTLQSSHRAAEARPLQEKALASFERTLPQDDEDVQISRVALANTLKSLGEFERARDLAEKALAVWEKKLPAGDPLLENARATLAGIYSKLARHADARRLLEQVLESRRARLPADHPQLLIEQLSLGVAENALGDVDAARAELERTLDAALRSQGEQEFAQSVRLSLGNVLLCSGDLEGARALYQRVLDNDAAMFPEDDPRVQRVRGNLATVMNNLGDRAQARELQEKVLDVLLRTLGPDHREVQYARICLANTLRSLSELEVSRALLEKAREVFARTLAPGDPDLHFVLNNLANVLRDQGDLDRADEVARENLELVLANFPEGSEATYSAREALAEVRLEQGQAQPAYDLFAQAVASLARAYPAESLLLQQARSRLAQCAAATDRPEEARGLAMETAAGLRKRLHSLARSLAPRPLEQAIVSSSIPMSAIVSLAGDAGGAQLDAEAFSLVETLRGAALRRARELMLAPDDGETSALRARVAEASAEVARRAGNPAAGSLADAVRAKERTEAELTARLAEIGVDPSAWEGDLARKISAHLAEDQAAIGFFSYFRETEWKLIAWVLKKGAGATRVELGSETQVTSAVDAWRETLRAPRDRGMAPQAGTDKELEAGAALRKLVFDPLITALGDAKRLVIALDGELHSMPLDALPMNAAVEKDAADSVRLGDRYEIEIQPALWQIAQPWPAVRSEPALLALGAIDYDALTESAADAGAAKVENGSHPAARSSPAVWAREFLPLPETSAEARTIVQLFAKSFGENARSTLREGVHGSREELVALAPRARFLHIATHGFFAPESVTAGAETRKVDAQLPGLEPITRQQQAADLSPMVLCGLALSGANLEPDEHGRIPGIVTGEEIAALDLSGCELAVLSACDTSTGKSRGAGQGVASLQKALHLAGARSVITSLWKVPDEATRDLMTSFYRRIWVEKQTKGRALWESKKRLREKKDSKGRLVYGPHDWAAWVLTGDAR